MQERDRRDLINPGWLSERQNAPCFTQEQETSKLFCIDGHVQGGDAKTRIEHEAFLGKEFTMPEIEDLAVAFSLHWVAKGEPLFEWLNKQEQWSFLIRCVGGALSFDRSGLGAYAPFGGGDCDNVTVGVSALASPE